MHCRAPIAGMDLPFPPAGKICAAEVPGYFFRGTGYCFLAVELKKTCPKLEPGGACFWDPHIHVLGPPLRKSIISGEKTKHFRRRIEKTGFGGGRNSNHDLSVFTN